MADPIYKNSTTLGDGKSDIIINTAGKIVVKVKDRYYNWTYNTSNTEKSKDFNGKVEKVNIFKK